MKLQDSALAPNYAIQRLALHRQPPCIMRVSGHRRARIQEVVMADSSRTGVLIAFGRAFLLSFR